MQITLFFSPGLGGSWDDADVGDTCVVKGGSTYKMWYWGDNETDIDQIGLATSNDAIYWQRTGTDGLVMSPYPKVTWENGEVIGSPEVIKAVTCK